MCVYSLHTAELEAATLFCLLLVRSHLAFCNMFGPWILWWALFMVPSFSHQSCAITPLFSQIFPSLCVSTLFLWVEDHFSSTLSDVPQCQPVSRHLARGYECRNALMQGIDLSNADKQSLTNIGKSRPAEMPTTGASS